MVDNIKRNKARLDAAEIAAATETIQNSNLNSILWLWAASIKELFDIKIRNKWTLKNRLDEAMEHISNPIWKKAIERFKKEVIKEQNIENITKEILEKEEKEIDIDDIIDNENIL